jgi:hypothetical protein
MRYSRPIETAAPLPLPVRWGEGELLAVRSVPIRWRQGKASLPQPVPIRWRAGAAEPVRETSAVLAEESLLDGVLA